MISITNLKHIYVLQSGHTALPKTGFNICEAIVKEEIDI